MSSFLIKSDCNYLRYQYFCLWYSSFSPFQIAVSVLKVLNLLIKSVNSLFTFRLRKDCKIRMRESTVWASIYLANLSLQGGSTDFKTYLVKTKISLYTSLFLSLKWLSSLISWIMNTLSVKRSTVFFFLCQVMQLCVHLLTCCGNFPTLQCFIAS